MDARDEKDKKETENTKKKKTKRRAEHDRSCTTSLDAPISSRRFLPCVPRTALVLPRAPPHFTRTYTVRIIPPTPPTQQ